MAGDAGRVAFVANTDPLGSNPGSHPQLFVINRDGMTTVLRENAVIQSNVAECEAKIMSSRAFLMEMLEEYWACLSAGDKPSFDLRARLRLSITYAMNQAREAATYAYHAAGTNAIFESNPFERRFRDIYTVSQQGQGHKSNYEPVGQVFMGLPPSGHRV